MGSGNPDIRKGHSLISGAGTKSMQSAMMSHASGVTVGTIGGGGNGVVVLDDEGNDVTPVSLVAVRGGGQALHFKTSAAAGASSTEVSITSMTKETVADVLNNLETMTMGAWNASLFGKSNLSYSNSSRGSPTATDDEKEDGTDYETDDNLDGEHEDGAGRPITHHSGKTQAAVQSREANSPGNAAPEADLNKLQDLYLTETDTIWLLDLPSVAVSNDFAEEAATVREKNAKYQELLGSRANNENFTDRGMQTFNNFLKTKEVQVSGPTVTGAECQVTRWAIYDAYSDKRGDKVDSGTDARDAEADADALGLPAPSVGVTVDAQNVQTMDGPGIPGLPLGQANAESMMLPQAGGGATGEVASLMASRSVFFNDDTMSEANFSVAQGQTAATAANEGVLNMDFGFLTDKDNATLNSFQLNQENLRSSLLIMERAVMGNNYEKKHLLYRNIDEEAEAAARLNHLNHVAAEAQVLIDESHKTKNNYPDEEANGDREQGDDERGDMDPYRDGGEGEDEDEYYDEKGYQQEEERAKAEEEDIQDDEVKKSQDSPTASIPTLNALWSYRCELTRGRAVMYMSWNKQNEDILAVAYGESKTNVSPWSGLILCWSPKNPEWPERVYRSMSAVTAIDFSRANPNLLAVGFMDGRIAVYDVRRKEDHPVLDSRDHPGKHRDPVWELKWVDRERVIGDDQSRGETLVSVSTDGRVCQWLIRKGIEYNDLMTLKRVTRQQEAKPGAAPAQPGAGGSNTGAGANNSSKTSAFIARQAGGLCFDFNPNDSNIYNEQYLMTQFGHTGAIYKVKWSPFLPGYFLSCSADWTIRFWSVDEEDPIFKFQGAKDAITDIAWSQNSSTVFGCVSNDGRMEIWDLQFSVLDPAILHTVLDRRLTAIIFATRSPTVLIGDDNGTVSVFNLKGGGVSKMIPWDSDKSAREIIEDQAGQLAKVIASKNQTANSAGTTGAEQTTTQQ
ncbi:WD repeat-containing protein 78 [Phlyctochytrium bullatum]|nr:WD repeat-containing protein 78 [Phlyctochytrium bullatum]